MSCILHIETATNTCSVALTQDGVCLFEQIDEQGPNHARVLAPFAEEALSFAESHAIPLNAVAVSMGPGSYTGLRIGVSTAKGICYGRGAKLVPVPTLQLLTVPLLLGTEEMPDDALLCPMIDARRMEVYCALYDRALREVMPTRAMVVEPHTFDAWLDDRPIYFIGPGSAKCRDIITHPAARWATDIRPLARHMMPLAERALARGEEADVAYFEPFYLKEFVATVSKKDVLHMPAH